jgi:hypothetical protein
MPPASSVPSSYRVEEMAYPSRTIAFQAAGMITSIMENLHTHNEIRYTPAFMYVDPRTILPIFANYEQCLQSFLGFDYARLPDAVICAFNSGYLPGEDQHLHASAQGRFQSLACGEDGAYFVRVYLGQQDPGRASSKSCRQEASTSEARPEPSEPKPIAKKARSSQA